MDFWGLDFSVSMVRVSIFELSSFRDTDCGGRIGLRMMRLDYGIIGTFILSRFCIILAIAYL